MLTKVKDPLSGAQSSNVVYKVPCDCSKFYIGETKRRLETRIKEHKDACQKGQIDKSAIAEHFCNESEEHRILWSEVEIVEGASNNFELLVKEALCIKSTPQDQCFNRDEGFDLPDVWTTLYRRLECGTRNDAARRLTDS